MTHEALKRLREIRYAAEPEELDGLGDAIVGSEDFNAACIEIAESAVEHELQAEAVAARIKELTERKSRLLRTAENLRNVVLQSMEIKGVPTIATPALTLSVSKRAGGLVITDESAIPARFFKNPAPVLDKSALKEAVIDDGEIIEGVTIGNGSISLTIRRK